MAIQGVNYRRSGAGGLQVSFKIDGVDKVSREFRDARKMIRSDIRKQIVDVGKETFIPPAKPKVPGIVRPYLTVRATGTRGYLTVQGRRLYSRILGLWNFGGTVRTPVRPVNKQALTIGPGVVRGAVTTPRHYRGTHHLERVVEGNVERFAASLQRRIMHAFSGLEVN